MPRKVKTKKVRRTTHKKSPLIASIDRAHEKFDSFHKQLIKQYKHSLDTAQKHLKKNAAALKTLKTKSKAAKTQPQKKQFEQRLIRLRAEKLTLAGIIEILKKRNKALQSLQKHIREFQMLCKKAKKTTTHRRKAVTKKATHQKPARKKRTRKIATPQYKLEKKPLRLSTAILKINAIEK